MSISCQTVTCWFAGPLMTFLARISYSREPPPPRVGFCTVTSGETGFAFTGGLCAPQHHPHGPHANSLSLRVLTLLVRGQDTATCSGF